MFVFLGITFAKPPYAGSLNPFTDRCDFSLGPLAGLPNGICAFIRHSEEMFHSSLTLSSDLTITP